MTNVTEPMDVNCSGNTLQTFIEVTKNVDIKYDFCFNEALFKNITDSELSIFIYEICVLDSDYLLNGLADLMLKRLKKLTVEEIQRYLELEDDFTKLERNWIKENELEYLISLNQENFLLQFPLECPSFYFLKFKFYSPMNVFLAKICQRADEMTAWKLSHVCKSLKNECDRSPIKVTHLSLEENLFFHIDCNFTMGRFKTNIDPKTHTEEYLIAVTKRKVAVSGTVELTTHLITSEILFKCIHFEWVILQKNATATFNFFESIDTISNFNLKKCPFLSILFEFENYSHNLDLDIVYGNLISKDFSKEIE